MYHHIELSDDLLKKLDVIYVTTYSKERFPDFKNIKKFKACILLMKNILKKGQNMMLQFYIRYLELMKYPQLSITL